MNVLDLDLTEEELGAVWSLPWKELEPGAPRPEGLNLMSIRTAVRVKVWMSRQFGYERPERGTPLWNAYMKIKRVAEEGCAHHRNVHDMFFTMVGLGGTWESLDDPVDKSLGFAKPDGSMRQAVYLTHYKETWGMTRSGEGRWVQREWDVPQEFRRKMKTPDGRAEVARILSLGDHCLEFPFEDDVPPIVHRYIANGGHL